MPLHDLAKAPQKVTVLSDSVSTRLAWRLARTCGITLDEKVRCWGQQILGDAPLPRPSEELAGATGIVELAASTEALDGLLCARDAAGEVTCTDVRSTTGSTRVPAGFVASMVAVADAWGCGIAQATCTVVCWGGVGQSVKPKLDGIGATLGPGVKDLVRSDGSFVLALTAKGDLEEFGATEAVASRSRCVLKKGTGEVLCPDVLLSTWSVSKLPWQMHRNDLVTGRAVDD